MSEGEGGKRWVEGERGKRWVEGEGEGDKRCPSSSPKGGGGEAGLLADLRILL